MDENETILLFEDDFNWKKFAVKIRIGKIRISGKLLSPQKERKKENITYKILN